jgi:hypothetical protein
MYIHKKVINLFILIKEVMYLLDYIYISISII